MRHALKETGKRILRLAVPVSGALMSFKFGELVATARTNWTLVLHEAPPTWLTEKTLAPWVQPALGIFVVASLLWALWPVFRGAVGWIVGRFRKHPKQHSAASAANLSLDIAFRQKHISSGWAHLSNNRDDDAWAIQYGPVLLTNLSPSDRLILDISLHLTGVRSADFKLAASDVAPDGRRCGIHGEIFRSPLTIEPQTAVEGKLVFLTPVYGAELMDKLLPLYMGPNGYTYSLSIADRVSGRSIDIPFEDYHGAP